MVLPIIVLALLGSMAGADGGQAAAPFDSSKAVLSPPKVVMEVDSGKLKGEVVRLAWGNDGSFFLRSAEMDKYQNELGKNFLITAGGGMKPVVEEPAWAAVYWSWKAGFAAPGAPGLRFDIESRTQNKTATGSTGQDFGGAGGGTANPNRSDPTANQIVKDLGSMQKVVTTTVRLKGELIAEAENRPFVPGTTFSWAPSPGAALAFVNARKRLIIVDREGRKIEVPGTADVLLPAWSPDGTKIAFLQRKDRKKYLLTVVDVNGGQ